MEEKVIVRARIGADRYVSQVEAGSHAFLGDEPEYDGGRDLGPHPKQFVLAGLATCTIITLRMYADRKGWPMEAAEVAVSMESGRANEGWQTLIHVQLALSGPLSDDQRERLLEIAHKCPVHQMLTHEVRIEAALESPRGALHA